MTIVTRGSALSAEMSEYLVREIANRPNITPRLDSLVVDARGEGRLQAVTIRDTARDAIEEIDTSALFILIGAEPRTGWLPAAIARDERGYILTGDAAGGSNASVAGPDGHRPAAYATSLPGVFAVGDVRLGSMKRIAAAVGEGSSAIRMVHDYLARPDTPRPT